MRDRLVDAGEIGVAAKGGAVTLTGYTDLYGAKLAAEPSGPLSVAREVAIPPLAVGISPAAEAFHRE